MDYKLYNYILVVGEMEANNNSVNIRYSRKKQIEKPLDGLLEEFAEQC